MAPPPIDGGAGGGADTTSGSTDLPSISLGGGATPAMARNVGARSVEP
eukprot:COSAG05_NODE_7852_length_763_cov_0.927711_3_plen_47_part_01